MSANCCGHHHQDPGGDPLRRTAYRQVLWWVLAINAIMFGVEVSAGLAAGSASLQANALDFLGDAANCAISLLVVGMTLHYRASAALAKGLTMASFDKRHGVTGDRCLLGTRNAIRQRVLLPIAASLLFGAPAQAEDKEPTAILELGGAGEWGLPGSSSFGPSAAVEFTPIKDWLEIEAGVSPLFHGRRTEWDTDLIFKKPFILSDKVEFMFGAGPAWSFSREGAKVSGELAADFMIWPTKDRKYGWFVEPTYNYSFAKGHEQSLGLAMGLLVPIP